MVSRFTTPNRNSPAWYYMPWVPGHSGGLIGKISLTKPLSGRSDMAPLRRNSAPFTNAASFSDVSGPPKPEGHVHLCPSTRPYSLSLRQRLVCLLSDPALPVERRFPTLMSPSLVVLALAATRLLGLASADVIYVTSIRYAPGSNCTGEMKASNLDKILTTNCVSNEDATGYNIASLPDANSLVERTMCESSLCAPSGCTNTTYNASTCKDTITWSYRYTFAQSSSFPRPSPPPEPARHVSSFGHGCPNFP